MHSSPVRPAPNRLDASAVIISSPSPRNRGSSGGGMDGMHLMPTNSVLAAAAVARVETAPRASPPPPLPKRPTPAPGAETTAAAAVTTPAVAAETTPTAMTPASPSPKESPAAAPRPGLAVGGGEEASPGRRPPPSLTGSAGAILSFLARPFTRPSEKDSRETGEQDRGAEGGSPGGPKTAVMTTPEAEKPAAGDPEAPGTGEKSPCSPTPTVAAA